MSENGIIPAVIIEGFRKLRKHSGFRSHHNGFYVYLALYTGYYDGKKLKAQDLGDLIDVSSAAISRQQRKVNTKLQKVKWKGKQKKSYNRATVDLKKVFEEIPEINFTDYVELEPGVYGPPDTGDAMTDHFGDGMTPVEWLARQHKNIMKTTHRMMELIQKDPKRNKDPKWIKIWLDMMTKVRPYIKDWLDLFGHLESDMLNEDLQKRVDIMSHTIDWINGRYPETAVEDVSDYILNLNSSEETT